MQTIKQSILTIIICLAVVAGVSMVSAWTGPTASAPNNNTPEPINVSATSQIKSGAFQVNGFRNLGSSIFDGNVGVGTLSPSVKLDVVGDVKMTSGEATGYFTGRTGLCINNDCRTSWPAGGGETNRFGGTYSFRNSDSSCKFGNPLAGNECSCPAGFTAYTVAAMSGCEGGISCTLNGCYK